MAPERDKERDREYADRVAEARAILEGDPAAEVEVTEEAVALMENAQPAWYVAYRTGK